LRGGGSIFVGIWIYGGRHLRVQYGVGQLILALADSATQFRNSASN
jgi:hypothetical protein